VNNTDKDAAARAFITRIVDRALERNDEDGLDMIFNGVVLGRRAAALKALAATLAGADLAELAAEVAEIEDTSADLDLDAERALIRIGYDASRAQDIVKSARSAEVGS